jgi:hypothetical protein
MRLSVLVSIIFVLAASMLTYAAPFGAPETFPDIEQRSLAQLLEPRSSGQSQHSKASSAHDTQLMLNVIFRSRIGVPLHLHVRDMALGPGRGQGRFFGITQFIDERLT